MRVGNSNIRILNKDLEQIGEIGIPRINRVDGFRKKLSRHKTGSEKKLKKALEKEFKARYWGKYGVRVCSQFIIHTPKKSYIVDFFITRVGVIIEVDGGYHGTGEQIKKDEARTKDLEDMGFRIYRFANKMVRDELPAVVKEIMRIIKDSNWGR